MAIELINPVIVPAQAEKVFNEAWVDELHIKGGKTADAKVRAKIIRTPYRHYIENGVVKGEIGVGNLKTVLIGDLFGLAQSRALAGKPELAQAMQAVFAAIDQIGDEVDANPANAGKAIVSI